MTRKDYIAIAETLKNAKPKLNSHTYDSDFATWLNVVFEFVGRLKADNGSFDRDRFEKACGL